MIAWSSFIILFINLFQYDTLAEKNKADKNKATVAEIYPWIKEEVRYELYDDYLVIREYSRLIFFENKFLVLGSQFNLWKYST